MLKLRESSPALGNDGSWSFLSDLNHPYPMIYTRYQGNERYIIVINPSDKPVAAEFPSQTNKAVKYIFGTTEKAKYKSNKTTDIINMPAVSAAIFKNRVSEKKTVKT